MNGGVVTIGNPGLLLKQHQVLVLGALLTLWAGVIFWTGFMSEEPARVPLVNVSGSAKGRLLSSGNTPGAMRVNLELLEANRAGREADFKSPKNIFDLYRPAEGRAIPAEPPPMSRIEPQPSPEVMGQQQAWQELAQFRYLGYLQMGHSSRVGEEVALVSKNEMLHTVRVGETIEGRILVKSITPTELTLQETRSQVEQRLPLKEGG